MNKQYKPVLGLALGVVWALAAGSAWAQWQWLDTDGRKIFSDKAPPSSIPESQILRGADGRPYVSLEKTKAKPAPEEKAPSYGFHEFKPEPVASPKPKAASPAVQKQATKTPKELEQEKKALAEKAAQEAQAKRQEQEVKQANCKNIRSNLATLDSGVRVATTNEKGERAVMGDPQRASERQRLQTALKDNQCN
ncbi:MAG: DUF4124 domain-containing protein [Brachymonas sp.]